jgi:hypothetical protein
VHPIEWPCSITWRREPPAPAQRAAWDKLWTRLLGHPGPETPQPQEDTPGAVDGATVSGGHNSNEDTANDNRISHHRK